MNDGICPICLGGGLFPVITQDSEVGSGWMSVTSIVSYEFCDCQRGKFLERTYASPAAAYIDLTQGTLGEVDLSTENNPQQM